MRSATGVLLPLVLSGAAPACWAVEARLEVCPREVCLADPVFVRVVVRNTESEPIEMPLSFVRDSTLFFEVDNHSSDYLYRAREDPGAGGAAPGVLRPGQECIVAYDVIELPPVDHFGRDFWDEMATLGSAGVRAILWHDAVDQRQVVRADLRIRERPRAEMRRLGQLYAESKRLRAADSVPADFDDSRPGPGSFGLPSLRPQEEVVGPLLAAEPQLSPGPLRDVLHLTNLMRAVYDGNDDPARGEIVRELLRWLDELPEIERHYLALRLRAWWSSCAPRQPVFFELAHGLLARLPERCYGQDDYPGSWRSALAGCPGYVEYVKRLEREGPDP